MKIINLTIGMMCLLWACHSNRMQIEGEIGELQENKIYLGEADPYYGTFKAIDSAEIKGGKFTFTMDSVVPQLLFLGFGTGRGGELFIEKGTLYVKPAVIKDGKITWEIAGSELNRRYRDFTSRKDSVRNQKKLDSLDRLFYAARANEDREEMARIKEESIVYYSKAESSEDLLVKKTVDENKDNAFGIYLYYRKIFGRKVFYSQQEIDREREYINTFFGLQARETPYKQKMDAYLDLCAACAIGAVAPEISGQDTLGNPIKLSDFRGKYVIVDFWNSYCHWCREETPWLRKAKDAFKDKEFTILGISNDGKKELWLKAIEEDHSNWDHLLVPPGDPVMNTYCIKGIPHIILVGPDGRILAKEMRHEELVNVPKKFIN